MRAVVPAAAARFSRARAIFDGLAMMSARTEKPSARDARVPPRPNNSPSDTPEGCWVVLSSTTDRRAGGLDDDWKVSVPCASSENEP